MFLRTANHRRHLHRRKQHLASAWQRSKARCFLSYEDRRLRKSLQILSTLPPSMQRHLSMLRHRQAIDLQT